MHLHKAPFPKVCRRGVPFQTAVPGVLLQNERSLMMNHIHLPLPSIFPLFTSPGKPSVDYLHFPWCLEVREWRESAKRTRNFCKFLITRSKGGEGEGGRGGGSIPRVVLTSKQSEQPRWELEACSQLCRKDFMWVCRLCGINKTDSCSLRAVNNGWIMSPHQSNPRLKRHKTTTSRQKNNHEAKNNRKDTQNNYRETKNNHKEPLNKQPLDTKQPQRHIKQA